MIKLFVGLGNPGAQYQATRHNAGFWWLDALAHELKVTLTLEKAWQAMVARTAVNSHVVWLLKPQTFMNLSGRSVAALARFYKISPHEILVAHDELDIVPGQLKLKRGGSHAGHNGLRDIHDQLGSDDYWRLRLGIGHPGDRNVVADYVLNKPSAEDRDAIDGAITRGVEVLPLCLAGDMQGAMQKLHSYEQPKPVEKKAKPVEKKVEPKPEPKVEPKVEAQPEPEKKGLFGSLFGKKK